MSLIILFGSLALLLFLPALKSYRNTPVFWFFFLSFSFSFLVRCRTGGRKPMIGGKISQMSYVFLLVWWSCWKQLILKKGRKCFVNKWRDDPLSFVKENQKVFGKKLWKSIKSFSQKGPGRSIWILREITATVVIATEMTEAFSLSQNHGKFNPLDDINKRTPRTILHFNVLSS